MSQLSPPAPGMTVLTVMVAVLTAETRLSKAPVYTVEPSGETARETGWMPTGARPTAVPVAMSILVSQKAGLTT
jgi:hypothetical protein